MASIKQYKIAKRLGAPIFEKCLTQRFALSEARGKKGFKRKKAPSDYGRQLLEKQKVRFAYGISEKQLVNYVRTAITTPNPTQSLYTDLETRLDNTVYKAGFAPTRRAARQMVSHGHITVNGKKMNVASHTVHEKDVIAVREGSKSTAMVAQRAETLAAHTAPAWLTVQAKKLEATVKSTPSWSVGEESMFDFAAVFEYYSR